jgi:phosphatidate cytidylyltransferase
MLAHRVATGLVLTAVLVLVMLLDELYLQPWYPLWLLLVLAFVCRAAVELCNLLNATSARPSTNTVVGGVVAVVLANWVPHLTQKLFDGPAHLLPIHAELALSINTLAWPLLAFVGVLMVAFLVQSAQFTKPGATMATLGASVLSIAYLGLLGTFVIQLRWLGGPSQGLLAVTMLMATAKGADTGAFLLGRIAGHHKLWPQLSPNKTIEGAVGGLVCAVLASFAVAHIAARLTGELLSPWICLGFGLSVGTAAQLGDLIESMIKRDCERKDASDALPGFGGVLDVIDSVLFAGPVAFIFWMLVP